MLIQTMLGREPETGKVRTGASYTIIVHAIQNTKRIEESALASLHDIQDKLTNSPVHINKSVPEKGRNQPAFGIAVLVEC